MTTPAQIRAARALLDWTQADLAAKASISPTSINTIEREKGDPKRSTLNAIRRALEEAGVEFTDGDAPGVRIRQRTAA
jgi:predicted transcriptional regulator